MTTTTGRIDIDRLHAFVHRFIDDLGTALHVRTVLVGDRSGHRVGCGHGASTAIMVRAFPNATFDGYDTNETSIDVAGRAIRTVRLGAQLRFTTASAQELPATGYRLVTCFTACTTQATRSALPPGY